MSELERKPSVRDSDVNLYRPQRLRAEFGPFLEHPGPDGVGRTANDIVGDTYRKAQHPPTPEEAFDLARSFVDWLPGYEEQGGEEISGDRTSDPG